jgi:hypothetical protein
MDEAVAVVAEVTAEAEVVLNRAMDQTAMMVAAVAAKMLAASPLPNIEKCLLPKKRHCDRDVVTGILPR